MLRLALGICFQPLGFVCSILRFLHSCLIGSFWASFSVFVTYPSIHRTPLSVFLCEHVSASRSNPFDFRIHRIQTLWGSCFWGGRGWMLWTGGEPPHGSRRGGEPLDPGWRSAGDDGRLRKPGLFSQQSTAGKPLNGFGRTRCACFSQLRLKYIHEGPLAHSAGRVFVLTWGKTTFSQEWLLRLYAQNMLFGQVDDKYGLAHGLRRILAGQNTQKQQRVCGTQCDLYKRGCYIGAANMVAPDWRQDLIQRELRRLQSETSTLSNDEQSSKQAW